MYTIENTPATWKSWYPWGFERQIPHPHPSCVILTDTPTPITGMDQTLNKSLHTKLTLEKKILPPLLPGFELATFWSRVWRSHRQAIPATQHIRTAFWNDLGTGRALQPSATGCRCICFRVLATLLSPHIPPSLSPPPSCICIFQNLGVKRSQCEKGTMALNDVKGTELIDIPRDHSAFNLSCGGFRQNGSYIGVGGGGVGGERKLTFSLVICIYGVCVVLPCSLWSWCCPSLCIAPCVSVELQLLTLMIMISDADWTVMWAQLASILYDLHPSWIPTWRPLRQLQHVWITSQFAV